MHNLFNESKDNPLVSIITPVLNGVEYLEVCIQSVLSQSYRYIEHIFVDGGSCDGSLDVLKSYKARHPDRIRLVSEADKKAGEAWNKGLRIARGGIFGWLGSDDIYEPGAVMAAVEFFRSNPEAWFVFGGCNYINEKGEKIAGFPVKDFDLEEIINDKCYMPTSSAFYKREVIEKVGFMDTSLTMCDLDYWIRAGRLFHPYRIEKVLSGFRIHKHSFTFSKGAGIRYARDGYIITRRYGGSIFSAWRRVIRSILNELLRLVLGPFYISIKKFMLWK